MSYEFKKLSEVEAMTEVPEGANMIAEVNGEIKRVPAATSEGGGSGGSGVKTAIIKASNYDAFLDYMSGKTTELPNMKNVTFSCTNMTFQEVYSAIMSGEHIDIICMFFSVDSNPVLCISPTSISIEKDSIGIVVMIPSFPPAMKYTGLIWDNSGISIYAI